MRRNIFTGCILLALIISLSVRAQTTEKDAQSLFDSLFGDKAKQVKRTIDRSDDVALAAEMLKAAKHSNQQPALVNLLCHHAHDLGMRHSSGYATAADAMRHAAQHVPDQRDDANDKLAAVLTRQASSGNADERNAAARELVNLLIAMGDSKQAEQAFVQATGFYRRALALARQRKLNDVNIAAQRLDQAMSRHRTVQSLERLEAQLLRDANNHTVAENIVRLHVVDLDNPSGAAPYLNRVKDVQLKAMTSLAARHADKADDLKSTDHLSLGAWYKQLSETAADASRGLMLHRAQTHLKTFRATHTPNDLAGVKADTLLTYIDNALKKESIASSPTSGVAPQQKTIDLLTLVDGEKDAVWGTWSMKGNVLVCGQRDGTRIAIPVQVTGNYVLEVQFMRTRGNNAAGFIIPVGDAQVNVTIDSGVTPCRGLDRLDGKRVYHSPSSIKGRVIEQNKLHTVQIAVATKARQATIVAAFDGKEFLNWTGNTDRLQLPSHFSIRDPKSIGLAAWLSVFEFRSVTLTIKPGGEVKRKR